jgi:hypothetical protein
MFYNRYTCQSGIIRQNQSSFILNTQRFIPNTCLVNAVNNVKVLEVFINIVIYLVITVNSDVTYVFIQGELHYINVRENWRCNHEWTFQKHLPCWLHITLVEDKQNKKHRKLKWWVERIPSKPRDEHRFSGRVRNSRFL